MLRLIANRNTKIHRNKQIISISKPDSNEDIIYNLTKNKNICNLKFKENNLHILNFIKYDNISCIDDLIPQIATDFLKDNNNRVRIILFNSISNTEQLIKNSIYYWTTIDEYILESENIDIIQINEENLINWNDIEIIQKYSLFIKNINCLGIVIVDKEDKVIAIKQNTTLDGKMMIYNCSNQINFLIEYTSLTYCFFYPTNIAMETIKKNFSYYTAKKQELTKKTFERKLNDIILILYPLFHKTINKINFTKIEKYQAIEILGKNVMIETEIIRNFISTEIYKFCSYFSMSPDEIDTFVGSFMEVIDNPDTKQIYNFLNEKLNPLLINHYNYCYYFQNNIFIKDKSVVSKVEDSTKISKDKPVVGKVEDGTQISKDEEYDSSSSYCTSDE